MSDFKSLDTDVAVKRDATAGAAGAATGEPSGYEI